MTTAVVPVESIRMPGASTNALVLGDLGAQLGERIDPSRVLTRMIDRIAFASDASLYRLIPRAVVQPINSAEVRRLFQFSRENKIPLTFRAGGTSLCGQAITDGIWWMSAATGGLARQRKTGG